MRTISALALAAALLAAPVAARAIGPLGPPGPTLSADERNSLEAGYFFHGTTWKPSSNAQGLKDFSAVDVEQAHGYLQGTLLAFKDGDWYLRAGGANFKETTAGGTFASGAKPFLSTGVRAALLRLPGDGFYAGLVAQGSLYASYSDVRRLPADPSLEVRADVRSYFDLSLGAGVQKDFGKRASVYGGAFAFYSQAKGNVASANLGMDVKTQFHDKNNLGLFAGARLRIVGGLAVDGEAQARGGAAYGVKVSYAF